MKSLLGLRIHCCVFSVSWSVHIPIIHHLLKINFSNDFSEMHACKSIMISNFRSPFNTLSI